MPRASVVPKAAPDRTVPPPAGVEPAASIGRPLGLREALRLCGGQRRPENPIEEADAGARLRREISQRCPSLSEEALDREAATSLGISVADLRRSLQLRELAADVRDMVADGQLSVDQALALARIPEARRQRTLAREAAAQALPAAVIEQAAVLLAQDPALRVRVAIQRARRQAEVPSAGP